MMKMKCRKENGMEILIRSEVVMEREIEMTEWREFCAWIEELPYFMEFKEALEK